jgi:hypothetical protein
VHISPVPQSLSEVQWRHSPSWQFSSDGQLPQLPPQPSSPQVFPSQFGVQQGPQLTVCPQLLIIWVSHVPAQVTVASSGAQHVLELPAVDFESLGGKQIPEQHWLSFLHRLPSPLQASAEASRPPSPNNALSPAPESALSTRRLLCELASPFVSASNRCASIALSSPCRNGINERAAPGLFEYR